MKKFLPMLLIAGLTLGAVSCKKDKNEPRPKPNPQKPDPKKPGKPDPKTFELKGTTWTTDNFPGTTKDVKYSSSFTFKDATMAEFMVTMTPVAAPAKAASVTFTAKYAYKKPNVSFTDLKFLKKTGDGIKEEGLKEIEKNFSPKAEIDEIKGTLTLDKGSKSPTVYMLKKGK